MSLPAGHSISSLQLSMDVPEMMSIDYIGPMPVDEFMEEFVPECAPMPLPALDYESVLGNLVATSTSLSKLGTNITKAIETNKLCPRLVWFDITPCHDDPRAEFVAQTVPEDGSSPKPEVWTMDLSMVCIHPEDDPFNDATSDPEEALGRQRFLRNSRTSVKHRSVAASYVGAQMRAQYLAFAFSILVLQGFVRFIRWDRSGAVVTERFDFRRNPKLLAEFFWRFQHLTPEHMFGVDGSAVHALPENIELMREKWDERVRFLARMRGDDVEAASQASTFGFDALAFSIIPVVDAEDGIERLFITYPRDQEATVTGSSIMYYDALDLETGELMCLKDAWRCVGDDMISEGDIYRILLRADVPRIPALRCAGDVKGQDTRTQAYTQRTWFRDTLELPHRRRHRLVTRAVGRRLEKFNSTRELCTAVFHAAQAHQAAFRADVLHSDIQPSSIIITDQGTGLLVDWDLARIGHHSHRIPSQRTIPRLGARQFISARLLQSGDLLHENHDDLDSFLQVLLYHSLRHRPNEAGSLAALLHRMKHHFEGLERSHTHPREYVSIGLEGTWKKDFYRIEPSWWGEEELLQFLCAPHAAIIEELRELFIPVHANIPARLRRSVMLPSPERALEDLRSEEAFVDVFRRQLAAGGWADDDRSSDVFAHLMDQDAGDGPTEQGTDDEGDVVAEWVGWEELSDEESEDESDLEDEEEEGEVESDEHVYAAAHLRNSSSETDNDSSEGVGPASDYDDYSDSSESSVTSDSEDDG